MQVRVPKIRARWPQLPACLTLILVTACAVSQQQEVELGATTAAQVSAELPLIRDAAVVSYINSLGNQLARVTDTRNLSWQFTVVDSKEVNGRRT
jgi:predicted Zn-dependent protease